jgi:hypothetical protein
MRSFLPNKRMGKFLHKKIVETRYFFIDLWHIVHLVTGFFIMKVLLHLTVESPFIWLLALLVLYEGVEYYHVHILNDSLFKYESPMNIFLDIVIGMLGGWIATVW